MITLRHFTLEDAPVLQSYYPDMAEEDLQSMLTAWQKEDYQSSYFEMFAICQEDQIVGEISLYEHTTSAVSIGPIIYEPFRRKGYATEAMKLALCRAKEKDYHIVIQQVRTDNEVSIALHKKLGFEIDGRDYVYKNKKDHPCYLFLLAI